MKLDLEQEFGIGKVTEEHWWFLNRHIPASKLAKWLGVSSMSMGRWLRGIAPIPAKHQSKIDELKQEILKWEELHHNIFNHPDCPQEELHHNIEPVKKPPTPIKKIREVVEDNSILEPEEDSETLTDSEECPFGAEFGYNWAFWPECEAHCKNYSSCEDWARNHQKEWEKARRNK